MENIPEPDALAGDAEELEDATASELVEKIENTERLNGEDGE